LKDFRGGAESGDTGVVFGREEFKRAERAVLAEKGRDGAVGFHSLINVSGFEDMM
jgi:hypothetical protein